MPSGPPSPTLPSPPPRLGSAPHAQGGAPAYRGPGPPPPPQPLPGARLRSHLPNPAQTSGAWPGPFPQPGAGGALSEGGVGAGAGCARLGAASPGARHAGRCHGNAPAPEPRARTRIVSICSQAPTATRGEAGRALGPAAEGKVFRAGGGFYPARLSLISIRSFSRRVWPRGSQE